MADVRVITNNHDREFKYRTEVPPEILEDQFDWLNEDDGYDGFIHYRGIWYHVSQYARLSGSPIPGDWDGYESDSFFSGTVIKISNDGETYKIGTYLS